MNKKTLIIICIELLVVCLVVTTYFFMRRDMYGVVDQHGVVVLDVQRIEANHKELESLEQNIGSTKDERDRLLQVFLSADGTVDFIDSIESLAKKTGVTFKVQTITEREDEPLVEAGKGLVVFSAEVEGLWDDTVHFLKLVENLPYKSSIETISVSNKNKSGEDKKPPVSFWSGVVTFSVVNTK